MINLKRLSKGEKVKYNIIGGGFDLCRAGYGREIGKSHR